MNHSVIYVPSRILSGHTEFMRRHGFTRWMSFDLLQATTDFGRNIGLLAVYSESSPENLHRYLLWRTPKEGGTEIRSGRSRETFLQYDQQNQTRGWSLLSLHVNEMDLYSAVWVSPDRYEPAVRYLAAYGILPAERRAVRSPGFPSD